MIVGVLYIIGTVAGVLGVIASGHVLKEPGVLDNVAAHEDQFVAGALLVLVMGLALAMVRVMMFPILKRQSETLALGYVVFRGALETVTYMVLAVCWLLLVAVGQEYAHAGAAAASQFQSLGTVLLKAGDQITPIQDCASQPLRPALPNVVANRRAKGGEAD